jgi:hypothetical protein
MTYRRCQLILLVWTVGLICAFSASGQDPQKLTEEEIREFLLKGEIIEGRPAPKGVTSPSRLTLKYKNMTHDAGFQKIDEFKPYMQFGDGTSETNFQDSYKYDIAAYELSKLLGLDDMMPVTVERKYRGDPGACSWWLSVKMDEKQRTEKHIEIPDPDAWNKQLRKMTVFGNLVYDMDRNQTNVLITEDWHLYMIDFSRAFRLYTTLKNPKSLVQCDRKLLQKLRQLDAAEVTAKTKNWLSKQEIKGLMARRDKIVAIFDDLIVKKGENAVLYD